MSKTIINSYLREMERILVEIDKEKINGLVKKVRETQQKEKTIFIMGNGGSASNASHWACDLGKGTIKEHYKPSNQKRLKIMCLSDNLSTITAYANDLSYDEIFSQQLRNFLEKDDLVVAMSASGNSKNILSGLEFAKDKGAYTFSLLGSNGGKAIKLSDDYLLIHSKNYGIVEDFHLIVGHIITSAIKKEQNLIPERK